MEATPVDGDAPPEVDPPAPEAAPELELATPEDAATGQADDELLTGEPAPDDVVAEVKAAVNNLAACVNEGLYFEFASLFTPNGLMEDCGTTNPYDGEWCFGGTQLIQIISIDNVEVLEDGRYAAGTTYQKGNMLTGETFIFVRQGDWLLVDASPDFAAEIPDDAVIIDGEMVDYQFVLHQESAPAGTIVFNVTNTGEYPHELVLFRFPEGATVDDLFEDESLFEQVQFFGLTWSEPGEDALPLILIDMELGVYTLLCFVEEPEGIPHIMRGMILEFEITTQ